jgi:adenine deaminase
LTIRKEVLALCPETRLTEEKTFKESFGRIINKEFVNSPHLARMATTPNNHLSGSTGAHLTISAEELMQLRLVALGSQPPSLIIRGGQILSLHTGEILPRDVVIYERHIAATTPWDHFPAGVAEIEAHGKFISPGFIDAHIHIEYTELTPRELARLSVRKGTTTILADAICIANVFRGKGMNFMSKLSYPIFHTKKKLTTSRTNINPT